MLHLKPKSHTWGRGVIGDAGGAANAGGVTDAGGAANAGGVTDAGGGAGAGDVEREDCAVAVKFISVVENSAFPARREAVFPLI